jgi:predicted nucleotidyltransferase
MINTYAGLLDGLARHHVKFALVGGLAVALNGFERTTQDVDILVDNSPENIARLAACLGEFGEGLGGNLKPEEVPNEPGAVRVSENFDLDIFVQMNGRTLADFAPMIREYTMSTGSVIHYLSAEGLVETKRGSIRHKDQADLGALRDQQSGRNPGSSFSFDALRDPAPPDNPS